MTPNGPTALFKAYVTVVTWLFRALVVLAVLLSATWLVIHGFIVPRIAELRPQLEVQASARLGIRVQIGDVRGESRGIVPSFELLDVRLLDAQGQEALHLPRVLASLSPRSLWNRGFEQLALDSPSLDLRRTADGRLLLAGLDLSGDDDHTAGLDWLLSQTEVVVRQGSVLWTDEQSNAPPLTLRDVGVALRHHGLTHELRLDATPPEVLGSRLSLQARMRQPLLSTNPGKWQSWSGQVYAQADQINTAALAAYLGQAAVVQQGQGALRVWGEVSNGRVNGLTADVALRDVHMMLARDLRVLSFGELQGRLSAKPWGRDGQGWEIATHKLQFTLHDGLRWPGGNVLWRQASAQGAASQRSELLADQLDLQSLSAIAQRLPQLAHLHAPLQSLAAEGLLERLQLSWLGSIDDPQDLKAQGRVSGLNLSAEKTASTKTAPGASPVSGRPGVRGAVLDFEGHAQAGKARLLISQGSTTFPGVFDEPELPWSQLSTDITWQTQAGKLQVQLPNLKFSQADAQGDANLKWVQSQPGSVKGSLDLQAHLDRAELNRVHRYMPVFMAKDDRDYLRESLLRGQATGVKIRLKGDLWQLPFKNGAAGSFKLSAAVKDAVFNPVPASLNSTARWPLLSQLSGELAIDNMRLGLKNIQGRWGSTANMRVQRGELLIPNLLTPVVQLQADLRSPAAELLGTIRASSLQTLTGRVFDAASGGGNLEAQLKLQLPVQDLNKTQVSGRLNLANNDLNLAPDVPPLSRIRGVVWFSEQGFALQGVQARLLGAEATLEGGSIPVPGQTKPASGAIHLQGMATAEGLRELRVAGLQGLLSRASGSTAYSAQLGLKGPSLDLQINSNLQGMAWNLPAPLGKTAAASLPLRVDVTPIDVLSGSASASASRAKDAAQAPAHERLRVAVGRYLSAVYIREVGDEPRVLQGLLQVGEPIVSDQPLPSRGVQAHIDMSLLDADAWLAMMDAGPAVPTAASTAASEQTAAHYMPRVLNLKAQRAVWQGRTLNKLSANLMREGDQWRAQVQAQELQGQLAYTPPQGQQSARLFARLSRLSLAASTAQDVESLLDEQPVSMPALDIVVDDLELRGKRLGRVEIEAVNRNSLARDASREWLLQKFNVIAPEATFMASGRWGAAPEAKGRQEQRRTSMSFKLDISDGGELLGRMGMKDVMRNAKGIMAGQVGWSGSPITPDYASMGGQFNVNMESGQFLKADPGIAKLLGVLNLQALPRRLTLDFRDVFSEGFTFDFIRGDVKIDQGMASTNNLQMKGVNAAVLMEGRADIARETQDIHVLVVPEINAGTASLIATYINPAVGLSSFLAQLILRRPLIDSTTQEFQITGPWADPKITKGSKNESDKPSKDAVKP